MWNSLEKICLGVKLFFPEQSLFPLPLSTIPLPFQPLKSRLYRNPKVRLRHVQLPHRLDRRIILVVQTHQCLGIIQQGPETKQHGQLGDQVTRGENKPVREQHTRRVYPGYFTDQGEKLLITEVAMSGNVRLSDDALLQGIDSGLRHIAHVDEVFAAPGNKTQFLLAYRHDHLAGAEIDIVGADHKGGANDDGRETLCAGHFQHVLMCIILGIHVIEPIPEPPEGRLLGGRLPGGVRADAAAGTDMYEPLYARVPGGFHHVFNTCEIDRVQQGRARRPGTGRCRRMDHHAATLCGRRAQLRVADIAVHQFDRQALKRGGGAAGQYQGSDAILLL